MKVIRAGHERIKKGCMTPYQFIETIGRTCYKSENKITAESAEPFVRGLVKRNHWAMLEHFTCTFNVDRFVAEDILSRDHKYITVVGEDVTKTVNSLAYYVSGSFRAWKEFFDRGVHSYDPVAVIYMKLADYYPTIFVNKTVRPFIDEGTCTKGIMEVSLVDDDEIRCNLKLSDEDKMKLLTYTVKFTCDRGVSHELVRHRPCSFAQESTRYCNYGHDNEITVIEPFFLHEPPLGKEDVKDPEDIKWLSWYHALRVAEDNYMMMLKYGATPQEARSVLPNSLKTDIIMTATEEEWQHIVDLRAKGTTGAPHPQMREIMQPWYEELKILSNGRIK